MDLSRLLSVPKGCSAFLVYYEDVLVYFTAAATPEEAASFACGKHPNLDKPQARERLCAVKLTEKLYRKEKEQIAALSETLKYLVFVGGKPRDIKAAKSAALAVNYFCHRHPEVDRELATAEILTRKLYRKHHKAIEGARQREGSLAIPWQPTLFNRDFGSNPTWAKTQARAGCNRWYTKKKKFENPTTPETKALYHDGVSARPLFGFPTKPAHLSQRKAHHGKQPGKQPELIINHHL